MSHPNLRDGKALGTVISSLSTMGKKKKGVVPKHCCELYEICPQDKHPQTQKVEGKFSSLLISH